jgi:hypothetical protein
MLPVTVINTSVVSLLFVFHYVVCSLSQTSNNFKHCSNFLEKWVLFLFKYNTFSSNYIEFGGCRGHHRMIVGFTTTYTICSYNHCCCKFEYRSWQGVLDTTLCDWSPWYDWKSVESDVKHCKPNHIIHTLNFLIIRENRSERETCVVVIFLNSIVHALWLPRSNSTYSWSN